MGVKRRRSKPEDRFVWPITMRKALVEIRGEYVNEDDQIWRRV